MLFPWVFQVLVAKHVERTAEALAGGVRHENVIEEAALGSNKRIGKAGFIVADATCNLFRIGKIGAVENFSRAL